MRYGVAPDHESTKNVMTTFRDILATRSRIRFIGNINVIDRSQMSTTPCRKFGVGDDRLATSAVGADELLRIYSAVVFATGATMDKKLGIPGENLKVRWCH